MKADIYVPVFNQYIGICDALPEELKDKCHAIYDYEEQVIYYNKENVTLGVLAHECSHAVIDLCDRLGILIENKNDETFCYLLQFLFEKVAEATGKYKEN